MSAASYESLRDVAPVSRETFEKLKTFEDRFQHWNRSINLVSPSQSSDLWHRHILDSAQLLGIEQKATRWVDLGSGGGFPGLIVAFGLAERSGHIDLVESNRKKAAFLQAMAGEFHLPARVIARRITDSHTLVHRPQIVTARALAPLADLLELSEPWLLNGSRALFHKGRDYRREVEESAHRWTFDLVEHRSKTEPDGVVLDISNVKPK